MSSAAGSVSAATSTRSSASRRAPSGFPGLVPAVWRPVSSDQAHGERGARRYTGLARLAPGVSLAEAAAEADLVDAALTQDYPGDYAGVDTRMVPLLDRYTAPVRGLLVLVAAAVVLVFAAGAASLSNLAVLRAAARSREAATRAALGATRLRRLSEAAAEQLLVAAVEGALGWCLWRWTAAASAALLPAGLAPDGYAASSALAAVCSFAFAALAALAAVVVSEVPATGGRAVLTGAPDLRTGSRTRRAAGAAAVVQVALSLVLVHAAFVFQGALDSLRNTDLGFHNRGVLLTLVDLRVARDLPAGQRAALVDRLIERVEALPGVARAAAGLGLPPDVLFNVVQLPRRVPATGAVEPYALDLVPVSPGYFDVLGVPILDGRAFGPGDAAGADPVVVLSESAARRFFGRADAAGRTLEVYPIAVAGVVGDVRYRGFREPPAETAYYALAQYPVNGVHLLVDGVGDFVPSASAVAAAVYDVEPGLVLGEVRVVGEPGPGDIGVPTAEAFLVAVLAGFAVLQMLVALYGAAAYSAVRRRPEYALRAALGAAPVRLVTAALRESLLQTVRPSRGRRPDGGRRARPAGRRQRAGGSRARRSRASGGRRGCCRGCGGVVSGGGARRSAGRSSLGSPLWLIRGPSAIGLFAGGGEIPAVAQPRHEIELGGGSLFSSIPDNVKLPSVPTV